MKWLKILWVRLHGWKQYKDNPFNPKAWFHKDYWAGEERLEDVIDLIKNKNKQR